MNALVSGRGGVAVLVDGDGLLASIHADEPGRMVQRQASEIGWLLGEARDVLPLENVTRRQVEEELKRSSHREETLTLALLVLDADLTTDIRGQAVQELEDLLQTDGLIEDLEGVLFSRPLPAAGDLVGAIRLAAGSSGCVSRLFGRLRDLQPMIRQVCHAWDGLSFSAREDQESWRFTAVREGLFRKLVEILGPPCRF